MLQAAVGKRPLEAAWSCLKNNLDKAAAAAAAAHTQAETERHTRKRGGRIITR